MKKYYKIKPEYLDLWGREATENYIVTESELERLSADWGKTAKSLIEQLEEMEAIKKYVFNDCNGNNSEEKIYSTKEEAIEEAEHQWRLLTKSEKEKYIKNRNTFNSAAFEVYEIEIPEEELQQYENNELETPLAEYCTEISKDWLTE